MTFSFACGVLLLSVLADQHRSVALSRTLGHRVGRLRQGSWSLKKYSDARVKCIVKSTEVVAIERLVPQANIADQMPTVTSFILSYIAEVPSSRELGITADYSYIHTNPQNNSIVPTFSLNGVALTVPFSSTSTSESKGNWTATAARSIEAGRFYAAGMN
jgi:hypothetical protein